MADLASKYRPMTFDDVVEQSVVVDILKNICSKDNLTNKNFLFIGPAGTGKTSISKVIGRELNGGDGGEVIEVDAATYGSVENVRELIKHSETYPLKGKYKIFIIDECHVISNTGWQAFLKTLESGPARSVFIFCTTNPEKIPDTILSRVQTFQLSKISLKGVYERLVHILETEKETDPSISYDNDAILFVAKLSNGGMRDAITKLTKVLSLSNHVDMHSVQSALNLPNYDDYFDMMNMVVKKDNAGIVSRIDSIYDSGVNFVNWFQGFHSFICQIIKYICMKDISKTMIPSIYESKLSNYGDAHLAVCIGLSDRLMRMNNDLVRTNYLQETAITYLCTSKGRR